MYGSVIFQKIVTEFAPSTFADSYKSEGIFCKIPVVVNTVYGIPTQRFTMIIVTLAIVLLDKNKIGLFIKCKFINKPFIGPLSAKI